MNIILFNRRKYMAERKNPEGAPSSIADATVTLSADSFAYTGNPITPGVTVVYDGTMLTVNVDYFVSYADNTNVGAGTVTITGTGVYFGSQVKTFQITSAAPVSDWNFDITLTVDSVASAALQDSSAEYCSTEQLNAYSMQLLPSGNLQFGTQAQGHAYIWGFESGHPMEISHLNATFTSRRAAQGFYFMALFSDTGRYYYESNGNSGTHFYRATSEIDPAFNYEDTISKTIIELTSVPYRAKFSKDGHHFYYAPGSESNILYHRYLPTAWDVTSYDSSSMPETSCTFPVAFRDFAISPSNTSIVVLRTESSSIPIYQTYAFHYQLNVAGGVFTVTEKGHVDLRMPGGGAPVYKGQAICINDAGTKMIVWQDNGSQSRSLYEYNLVAAS